MPNRKHVTAVIGDMPARRYGRAKFRKGDISMRNDFRDISRLIERLHRRLLDVVRADLTRAGITDLNGVQALLLANIGTEDIAVRDLIERGYYLGSNVSYNLKKLTELGYLEQRQTPHDRRSVTVRATEKASSANAVLLEGEALHSELYAAALADLTDLATVRDALLRLDLLWTERLSNTAVVSN